MRARNHWGAWWGWVWQKKVVWRVEQAAQGVRSAGGLVCWHVVVAAAGGVLRGGALPVRGLLCCHVVVAVVAAVAGGVLREGALLAD
jgi:hypothetical protein